jgi:Ca2+-binding RTX toxin-like protein
MANYRTLIAPWDENEVGTTDKDVWSIWGGNDTVDLGAGNDVFYDDGIAGGHGAWGSGNDKFYGNVGNDRFYAGDGNNVYDGGTGSDTVDYSYAHAGVTVDLLSDTGNGDGSDTLNSIENATGSRYNDTLRGDGGANVFQGGFGSDLMDGRGGTDTADYSYLPTDDDLGHIEVTLGENGADGSAREYALTATSSGPQELLVGTDTLRGIENVRGSDGDDSMVGNSAANQFVGNAGNDRLTGGGGADRLEGGAGADTFIYRAASESTLGATDVITDFQHGVDKVDLSGIDAISMFLNGNQQFQFAGQGAAPGMGQVSFRYDAASNRTFVEGNTDFDPRSEFQLAFEGNIQFTASDFVL